MLKIYQLLLVVAMAGLSSVGFASSAASVRPAGTVTVNEPLPDTVATAGDNFVFEIPAGTFKDASSDPLIYTTSTLPTWLGFDGTTFSGIPANADHGTLTIIVTASDDSGNSADDTFEIVVRAIPVIDINGLEAGIGYSGAVLQEDGPDSVSITDPNTFVTDQDGTTITEAFISLSDVGLYDRDQEYLVITDDGRAAAQAAGLTLSEPYYNSTKGFIIITGEASFADYNAVLRQIQYANTSEDLEGGTRSVVFTVNDVHGNEANTAISNITIVPENDPPVLDLDSTDGEDASVGEDQYETTYVEDRAPVAVADNRISIEDVDYTGVGSVTISLVNRPDSTQETLQVIQPLPGVITASFNDTTGVMRLIGGGSLDAYAEAIQRIGYHNASQDPDVTQRRVFILFDDGGGDNSTSQSTTLVNVVPVNDPPNSRVDSVTVAEYSMDYPLALDTLPSDIDNELSELTLTVASLPDQGTVTYANGTPVRVNDILDSAQFADLQYDTPSNYDETSPVGSLLYDVSDGEYTERSTIVFVINNAPEADDFTVTTDEDVRYVYALNDFAALYSDQEDDPLAHIAINSLPADGLLLYETDTVQLGDEIRVTALDSGKLVFVPDLNENGDPYTSFLFRVKDERGASSEPYVANIIVAPVSDPPSVDTVWVSGLENRTLYFTLDDFLTGYSDPEDDLLTKISIGSLPEDGTLRFNGELVKVGDEIAADEIENLAFVPDINFDGVTEFLWNGYDGTAFAEQLAPVIITIREDNRLSARNDTIRLVDVIIHDDSLVANVRNPLGKEFTFTTEPVVSTMHGTLTLRADGSYTYQTTEDFFGEDSFTFEVCNEEEPPYCAQATITILVAEPLQVYEGFSPDGDGVNDTWRIKNIENYPNNTVRIFNRWGNVVFEMDRYNNEDRAWSSNSTAGLVVGDVPDGTYFYLIELGTDRPPLSGYVVINR